MQPQIVSDKRRFTRFEVREGVYAHFDSDGAEGGVKVRRVAE